MANFVLIALCIGMGALFRYRKLIPEGSHKGINAWIINIALPAVSFKYLPSIVWTNDLLVPALSPIVLFLAAQLYVAFMVPRLGASRANTGVMQLTAGLSNTSFVGFPLIVAYFSEKELSIAIICDQITFLLFSVFGIIIAVGSAGKAEVSLGQVLKKVLLFPPLLGCVAALTLPRWVDVSPFTPLFNTLATTVAPLALFSIGLQLSFTGWRGELKYISTVLFYKLLIAPALILGLVLLIGAKGIIPQIAVFEAAMPILLSVGVLADVYGMNPKLANLIIGVSILTGFITTFIWFKLIMLLV